MSMIRHYYIADQFEFTFLSGLSQSIDEQTARSLASKDANSVEADRGRVMEDVWIM